MPYKLEAEQAVKEMQVEQEHGVYVSNNQLMNDDGTVAGTFSSHWSAVAAMLRLSNPAFKSLGGDKPEDLEVERRLNLASKGTTNVQTPSN